MAVALLDLLDSELRLHHAGRELRSPGYALLDGDSYRFGDDARRSARRQPRYVNTRYWWQLGTQALQPALGPARHSADLVHAHLQALHREAGEPGEMVLAVPDSFSRDQLALLLGITQACPFTVVGLVNRSLLAVASQAEGAEILHLELQMHQALLTRLTLSDGQLRLAGSQAIPGSGLLSLQEAVVERIARAFINSTRFDPRRKAETEQSLYDQLFSTMQALRDSAETVLDINGYSARVSRDDLSPVTDRLQKALVQAQREHEGATLLLDPLAALLPGFVGRFPAARVVDLERMPDTLTHYRDTILQAPDDLHLLKGLPVDAKASAAAATPPPAKEPAAATRPTHLLQGHRARALGEFTLADDCRLHRTQAGWHLDTGAQAQVNGAPYRGQALETGDEVRIGTARWQLIEVENAEA
jgi:hypothetical protein